MSQAQPNLERLHVLDERGGRRYIYPADVRGRFTRYRPWLFLVLIAVYVSLPWIPVGGHPAIFLDIAARRFFIFGRTFNAQDFYLVFFLLTGVGFLLIVLAALFGRIWCGWACPQTVFLEGVYRRIERFIEGPASKRQALAKGPYTVEKFVRKTIKHVLYLAVSFVLAHLFLAYFISAEKLLRMIAEGPQRHWGSFLWGAAITALLYWNFFWFREQLCLIVCPYGRLQSAMQDPDTINIGYDAKRGEPRGKLKVLNAGDCIDCRRCVAVCPTGIDIRNGLQLECIGCAACIDACDDIMKKVERAPGLIRYDSERSLKDGARRFLRPRLYLYSVLGAIGLAVSLTLFIGHVPFEANTIHGRGAPYVLDGEVLRNQILVHLVNKNPGPSELHIEPAPIDAKSGALMEFIIPQPRVKLGSLESLEVPVLISLPRGAYHPGMRTTLRVRDSASQTVKTLEVRLSGPARPLP
jgi:cytochrome c oxidase accessory protein FixG